MEKNESILKPEIVEYLATRPVGARIQKKEYYLWEDIIDGCRRYKIKMSPDFMEFMIECTLEVRDMYFPIAKASGIEPIAFALERLKKQAEIMKNNKNWIEETDNLHNNITKETDKTLVAHISKK